MTSCPQPANGSVAQTARALAAIVSHCGTASDENHRDARVTSARRLAEALRGAPADAEESMRIDTAIERVVTYISLIESACETGAPPARIERMRREAHEAIAALTHLPQQSDPGHCAQEIEGGPSGAAPGARIATHGQQKPAGRAMAETARPLEGALPRDLEGDFGGNAIISAQDTLCFDVVADTASREATAHIRDPFWVRPPEWQILLENGRFNQTLPRIPAPPHETAGPCPYLRRRMTAAFSTLIAAALATLAFAE